MSAIELLFVGLARRKRRNLLIVACVATLFFIYGVLFYLYHAVQYANGPYAERRVTTMSAAGFLELMPRSFAQQIAAIPGVARVSYASFFNAFYRAPQNGLMVYAVEPKSWLDIYTAANGEWLLKAEDRARFMAQPNGILVGDALAQAFGWRSGDRITLTTPRTVLRQKNGSTHWDFVVSGVFSGRNPNVINNWGIFHQDYLDRLGTIAPGQVAFVTSVIERAADVDPITRRIDAQFAGTATPTTTLRENDFSWNFFRQRSNAGLFARAGTGVAALAFLLVIGNAMATGIFERRKEIAVLRALGFSPGYLRRVIVGEAVVLGLLGALSGFFLSVLWLFIRNQPRPGILLLPEPLLTTFVVMVGFAFAISVVPVVLAGRTNVARALTAE